jgi:hypothetical protein
MITGSAGYSFEIERYESWGLEDWVYLYKGLLEIRKAESNVAITQGVTSQQIDMYVLFGGGQISDLKFGVMALPNWDAGSIWVTDKIYESYRSKFTLHWTNAAPAGAKMDIWTFRGRTA